MKLGDMVCYEGPQSGFVLGHSGRGVEVEQRMVEIHFIGIIVDGPDHRGGEPTYKVWWMNQRNDDGSAKMGWWQHWRLRVVNEDENGLEVVCEGG